MPNPVTRRAFAGGLAALPVLARAARAEEAPWPNRPVRLIYPFAPGGGDAFARTVAERLRETLGQSVVVENRPGANTIIAAEATARAPKDGYTIGWVATSTLSLNPNLYASLPYRLEDFAPLCQAYRAPLAFAVSAQLPIRTVAEALDYIRANPGAGCGSVGNGSSPHIAMELMMARSGVRLQNVAYRGEAPIVTDLGAGRIPFYAGSVYSLLPFREGGTFRILALTSAERLAIMPEVPTLRETVHPDVVFEFWHGVVAPAGVPQPVLRRLADALSEAIRSDFVRSRATPDVRLDPVVLDDFAAMIRGEQARYGALIRERGITL
ncbi:tripartite tricarboxylate transporter substrate binding protein [Roseomonas sp. NAR14]|uniref:Tripartite tricarboxylate transporter substrate binding protein n=1 Tax=Roseomonas acroporae TaxID=2937791 RepID=A0A9X2BUV5_9PROT|nr:tripartite tricarboxylate transporter substrate binding protein [Roseomonas acroporae]MCK8785967.1 tripartite tricarboxylate transporter substrate binding protein [Roseomonas acroporae]